MKGQLERTRRELEDLKDAIGLRGQDVPSYLPPPRVRVSPPSTVDERSGSESPVAEHDHVDQPETFFGLSSASRPDQIYQLGNFHLTAEQVHDLLLSYATHQHKHMPIVDTTKSYHEMHLTTPFLFWTMLVVAMRGVTADSEMLESIRKPYNEYLGQAIIQTPLSMSTIQALLLMCLWPFPIRRQREDPSWNLCNVAMSALSNFESTDTHRTQGKVVNSSWEHEQTHCKTWLASFHIHTWLCSNIFSKATLSHTKDSINRAIDRCDHWGSFSGHLEIQRQVSNYTSVFTQDDMARSAHLVEMFDQKLSNIAILFRECWTQENEFALLAARLNLYSTAILASSHDTHTTTGAASGQVDSLGLFLVKGFHAAIKLINVYIAMVKASTASSSSLQPTYWIYPKHYHFAFARATFWLVRYVVPKDSNFAESDRDVARNSVRLSHEFFSRRTTGPDCEAGNVARVIEKLLQSEHAPVAASGADSRDHVEVVRERVRRQASMRARTHDQSEPIREVSPFTPSVSMDSPPHGLLPALPETIASEVPFLLGPQHRPEDMNFNNWQFGQQWPQYNVSMAGAWDAMHYQAPIEPTFSSYDNTWQATAAFHGFTMG